MADRPGVAVITGASRGLGAGMAERLAEVGYHLGVCARTRPETPHGATAVARSVDVSDAAALDQFGSEVVRKLGAIDLWINNAGVLDPMGPHRDHDPDVVQRALAVNVGGVVNGTRTFARLSAEAPPGRRVLINISSGAATSIYEGWSIYGATKAAVNHFTEIVAAEEPDLVCHALAPGVVDTDMQAMIRTHTDETFPAVARFQEMHRTDDWNTPAWVADQILAVVAGSSVPDTVVWRVPDEPRT